MRPTHLPPTSRLTVSAALAMALTAATALALSACDKSPSSSPGQKVDAGIQRVEQKVGEVKAEASREVGEVKRAASAALQEARQNASDATVKVSSAINDAAITASVKAKLATEAGLDASQISVETAHGRVSLQGRAANLSAIARAADIAATVDGVTAVDNRLLIKS